jgi:hypothetical protein
LSVNACGSYLYIETSVCPIIAGNLCEYNVDECEEDPCQNGGTCVDEVGSYHCKCLPGYEGKFMVVQKVYNEMP